MEAQVVADRSSVGPSGAGRLDWNRGCVRSVRDLSGEPRQSGTWASEASPACAFVAGSAAGDP